MKLLTLLLVTTAVSGLVTHQSSLRQFKPLRMNSDEFTVAVLGDLHLDPRYMDDHIAGREHVKKILEYGKRPNSFVVSLGGKFYL